MYTFGFVLMTPQLYINYKLKSVAHLPWRFLCYRSLNTVIDDLFAFVIRMPTMHRLVRWVKGTVEWRRDEKAWTKPEIYSIRGQTNIQREIRANRVASCLFCKAYLSIMYEAIFVSCCDCVTFFYHWRVPPPTFRLKPKFA